MNLITVIIMIMYNIKNGGDHHVPNSNRRR